MYKVNVLILRRNEKMDLEGTGSRRDKYEGTGIKEDEKARSFIVIAKYA